MLFFENEIKNHRQGRVREDTLEGGGFSCQVSSILGKRGDVSSSSQRLQRKVQRGWNVGDVLRKRSKEVDTFLCFSSLSPQAEDRCRTDGKHVVGVDEDGEGEKEEKCATGVSLF